MNKKRYAITLHFYIYEDNDFMARKKAHEIKKSVKGDHVNILSITDAPYGSIQTRDLDDISEPSGKKDDKLPF